MERTYMNIRNNFIRNNEKLETSQSPIPWWMPKQAVIQLSVKQETKQIPKDPYENGKRKCEKALNKL